MVVSKEFRMRLSLRAVLPLLLLFSITSRAADKDPAILHTLIPGTLRLCVSTAFPPVLFEDHDGRLAGFDFAFLKGFAEEQHLKLISERYPFDGLWSRPGRNECDIAAAGISVLASRASEGVVWSEPYFNVQRTLLIRGADAGTLKAISDFGGRKIGFVGNSMAEGDVRTRAPDTTILLKYTSALVGLEDLKAGRIDAFADGSVTSSYFAAANPGLAIIDAHALIPLETLAFPVRAASGLLDRLNAYIERNRDRYGHPAH
jgi:ABC-type amino acid transport substrate-binding protein